MGERYPRKFFCFPIVFLLVFGLSCQKSQGFSVSTGAPPFSSLLQEVLGNRIQVVDISKGTVSLESQDLSLKMIDRLSGTQMYFSFQLPLEKVLQEKGIFDDSQWIELDKTTPLETFSSTTQSIGKIEHKTHNHSDGIDPHFWMSPMRMARVLEVAVGDILQMHPEYREEWEQRLTKVLVRLQNLDTDLKELSAKGKRTFLLFHPALGYLAKDYGFVQLAIEEEGKEPGLKNLLNVIPRIKKEHISTLFIEPGTPKNLLAGFQEALSKMSTQDKQGQESVETLKIVTLNIFSKDYEGELRKFIQAMQ